MSKLRIVVADDHALLRGGLTALISAQSDMEIVGEAATADEALQVVSRLTPDLLTLDLTMPGGSSVKAIEKVRQQSPDTKVLVLTMHDDSAYLRATLAAGADGYLVKTATDAEMLSALRAVAKGRTVVNLAASPQKIHAAMISAEKPESPGHDSLSERELEVIRFLAKGHTNQEIADKLFLSVKTIETYRSRIGTKLGLKTRADIVKYVTELGLLD